MAMPLIVRQVFGSEKFVYVTVLFMVPLTVFAAMGKVSIEEWRHDALWALGLLVGGKTIQGAAEQLGGGRAPKPRDRTSRDSEPPPL